jgi:hypothetical protein
MLTEVLQSLNDWSVAAAIRRSVAVYPVVNATHIFALTLLVGGILPADLRLLGRFPNLPLEPFARLMSGIAAVGLALAIGTGFLLFSVRPLDYAGNPAFLTKIGLVGAGTLLALAVRFSASWRRALAGGGVETGLRLAAIGSIVVWLSALLAGRLIAFV